MTDRVTSYFGELIPETDPLKAQQFGMTALAYAMQAVLGTGTVADGLACTPTTPASLSVLVGPGSIYAVESLEATTWSSLPANTTESIVKQGILHSNATLAITPPGTVGFSQVYLIEAQYQDEDTTPVLLPYYNASNPSQPFQGPNNSGQSQNTVRLGLAAIQVKAGVAAATGTQVAPTPDAGWTGLWFVTVANGQSTITSGNIAVYSLASFVPALAKLPALPSTIQGQAWSYVEDSSISANTLTLAPSPPFAAYVKGQRLAIKVANTSTGAVTGTVSGMASKSFTRRDGNAFVTGDLIAGQVYDFEYNGTAWAAMSLSPSEISITANIPGRMQIFTSSGTFTVPAANTAGGTTTIQVELQAAGGGAGASGDGSGGGIAGNAGAGGGGGAYGFKTITGLTPGSTIPVTLGAAGVGVTNSTGTNAASSSFGSYMTCAGGGAGSTGISTSTVGGIAGTATGADLAWTGTSGGFTGPNSASFSSSVYQSIIWRGGQSRFGLIDFGVSGGNGVGYGSGGNGATGGSGLKGGNGAPAICIVRW